jgi:hypothetical protein
MEASAEKTTAPIKHALSDESLCEAGMACAEPVGERGSMEPAELRHLAGCSVMQS